MAGPRRSRLPAFAEGFGGHGKPLPQKQNLLDGTAAQRILTRCHQALKT
jgi:hypothetical protein